MTQHDLTTHAQNAPTDVRRMLRLLIPLSVLVLLGLATLACGFGVGSVDGFALGRVYRLNDGEQRDGDYVVFAYEIDYQTNSTVDGNLTLASNHVTLDAVVHGDVVVVADRLTVGDAAVISGNLTACVNTLEQADGAQIEGELRQKCVNDKNVSVLDTLEDGWANWRDSVYFRISTVLLGALLFGALAALGTVFCPRALARMSQSLQQVPFLVGGVGLITVLMVVGLSLLYAMLLKFLLPLVLLPVVMLLWLVILGLSLLGWLALAEPFGVLIFRLLRLDRQPRMIMAAVGGIVLAVLLRVWSVFLYSTWSLVIALLIFTAIGLGQVIITRAGTLPYTHLKIFHKHA